eukprot:Phypoly_transcript_08786.p1 GENE.Phypoly_transcript_08786~~Phypoly_transcript_08786.p1  ORF type:complete len:464 (+),score=63.36 Phypoly_transcript_08786:37-1428(+)
MRIACLALLFITLLALPLTFADSGDAPAIIYVWCGQNKSLPGAADFVAVIDFDPLSTTYGQVLKTVPLPATISTLNPAGNEAHHAQVSADGQYYISGGLLSFLNGKDEVFVWKMPAQPKDGPEFLYSLNPPGACTDEFVPVGGSQFLVSQMCSATAGSPGDIVLIDAANRNFTSILANISEFSTFNPHGFQRAPNGLLTIANYILPSSLLAPATSDLVFRDTVVSVDSSGHLKDTYSIPCVSGKSAGVGSGNGYMDFKYIPNDPYNRGYACGTNDNQMYLLRSGEPPLHVFDLSYFSMSKDGRGGLSAGIVSYSQDGSRMVMTLQMKWVVLLNISDPEHPRVLDSFYWCNATALVDKKFSINGQQQTFSEFCATGALPGNHYVLWPQGQERFIVVNYFLTFGLAQFPGTRTVHAFKFTDESHSKFEYDGAFDPNPQLSRLSASPHAVTFFPTDTQGNSLPLYS